MNIRRALIALGLAAGLSLGFSGIALADPYDCSNGPNPVPANVSGDAEVSPDPGTEGDDCVLNNLTVSGTLTITAPGTITAQSLTSGSGDLMVSGGTISIAGTVNANGGEAWIATGSGPTSVQKVTAATNIRISGGGVTAGGNPLTGGLTANGGGVFVTSGNTTHITAPVNATQNINISGQQALTVDKVVTSTGGTVNLQSNSSSATVSEKVTGYSYVVVTARTAVNVVETESTNNYVWIRSTNGDIASMGKTDAYDRITIQALNDVNIVGDVKSANNYVSATGRNITSDHKIDAGSSISITSNSNGAIDIDGTLTTHIPSLSAFNDSSVSLSAGKSILTGSINTASLYVYAYQNASPTTYTVGGSPALNGVNGTITVTGDVYGSLNISNGLSTSTGGNITITSASALNYTSPPNSQGGITLSAYGGTLSLPANLTLSVDGAPGKKAGFLTLNARRIDALDSVVLTASQDNTAAGSAHYVAIATDQLNYGDNFTIRANGNGANTTSRAQVSIVPYYFSSPTNNLAISGTPGSHLQVSANGENAAVTISGDTLSFVGGTATIESKGFLNHTITLKGRSVAASNLTISNTGAFLLDASGVNVAGDEGGDVTLTVNNMTLADPSQFAIHADGTGTEKGGNIVITSTNDVNFADLAQDAITAKGGDDGEGGTVEISNIAAFSVNKIIKVDGGSSIATSDFDGSISLNGILCQQWKTTYDMPTTYWNCVNPDTPFATDEIPADIAGNLPVGIRDTIRIAGNEPTLYVMVDPLQMRTYFTVSAVDVPDTTAGYTFTFGGAQPPIYTAVFQNMNMPRAGGYIALPDDWIREATTHEFGHQLDIALIIESTDPLTLEDEIGHDFAFLDELGKVGGVGPGLPCTAGSGIAQGPFVGVTDSSTGLPFCTGAVLNDPSGRYAGKSNGEIAQLSTQNLMRNKIVGVEGFPEPYAQAFAYQAYSSGIPFPPGYFDPTADGLFQKGYFSCLQDHITTLLGVPYTKVYTYACH